jgi:hypothetical protein
MLSINHNSYYVNTTIDYAIEWTSDRIQQLIRDGFAHRLLTHDQLLQEQQAGRVFNNFKEGIITFDPSYKYVPGVNDSNNNNNTNTGSSSTSSSSGSSSSSSSSSTSSNSSIDHDIRSNNYHANRNSNGNKRIHSYKKDRTPAWCDRILWSLKRDRLASSYDDFLHHHQSNDDHLHHHQSNDENNSHHQYHSGSNDCQVNDQLDTKMSDNHDYHHDNLINSMVVADNVNVIESNDETIEKFIDKDDVNRVNCDNNVSTTLVSNTVKSLSSISSSSSPPPPPTSSASSRDSVSTVQPQPQQQLPSQSLQASSSSSSSPNSSSRRLSPTLPYYHSFSPFDKRMYEGLELMEYSRLVRMSNYR